MKISYNSAKNAANIELRGLSFELAAELEWQNAIIWEDMRDNYGEKRYCALAPLNGRLHAIVFTMRSKTLRVISLRKANKRERNRYEKKEA